MKKDLIIIILLLLPAMATLFRPGYFTMHDDLQSLRQLEMNDCFADGQIPCRWVTHMGYGYGYPLFDFYPPFPYLVGHVFHSVGMPYIDTVKAVGVTGFVFTAIMMYLLGRQFWGRSGGLIASAFYSYAPYHSLDFYVRGAMNEFWAMAFYPAIFYAVFKLIQTRKKIWLPISTLFLTGLMLSHNLMLMIFAPFFAAWVLFWVIKYKSPKALLSVALAGIWAVSLAAFFTLPVIFEQKYAHVESLISGYFNYLAHYLNLNQIFFRINWGYGESILGPNDTMSFALGYLQWLVPGVVLVGSLISSQRKRLFPLAALMISCFLIALFMTHSRSTPIWIHLAPLQYLQFPWRFLTLAVFFLAFLSGGITQILTPRLAPILIALVLLLNANYFKPRQWYPTMTDAEKFSGKSWQLLVTSGIFDYLPIWAPLPPVDPASPNPNIIKGLGSFETLEKKSQTETYQFTISSPTASVQLQKLYFPGWRVFINGTEQVIDPTRDPVNGRIEFDLTSGVNDVKVVFTNTPIRTVGNTISAVGWVALLAWLLASGWAKIGQWIPKSRLAKSTSPQ